MASKLDKLQSIVGLCSFLVTITSQPARTESLFDNVAFKYETYLTPFAGMRPNIVLSSVVINVIGLAICSVFSYLIIWLSHNGRFRVKHDVESISTLSGLYLITNVSYFSQLCAPSSWFILTMFAIISLGMVYLDIEKTDSNRTAILKRLMLIVTIIECVGFISPWLSSTQLCLVPAALFAILNLPYLLSMPKTVTDVTVFLRYSSFIPLCFSTVLIYVLSPDVQFDFPSIYSSLLLDILMPSTCPTFHPFKILLYLLSATLFGLGCHRLKVNEMPFWENWKIPFFTVLMMNSIFSSQLLLENKGLYVAIQAKNDVNLPSSWRSVAQANHNYLGQLAESEAERLDQLNFREALSRNESNYDVIIDISTHLQRKKKLALAEHWARFAMSVNDCLRTRRNLVEILCSENCARRMVDIKTILTEKRDAKQYKLWVNILNSQNQTTEAITFVMERNHLHSANPKIVSELQWMLFHLQLNSKNFTGALSPLLDLVKYDPNDLRARTYSAAILGTIATDNQMRMNAISHLEDVLKLDPKYSLARMYIGKIYCSNDLEEFKLALPHLKNAHKKWPNNLFVIYDLCRATVATGNTKDIENIVPSIEYLVSMETSEVPLDKDDLAALNDPLNYGRIWMLLASAYTKLKQWKVAQAAYKEAKLRLESSIAMWSDLGICLNYLELNKLRSAGTCVDKLLQEYDDYPEFKEKLVNLYDMIQRLQQDGRQVTFQHSGGKLRRQLQEVDRKKEVQITPKFEPVEIALPRPDNTNDANIEETTESEMKAALKNLVNLHANQRKTNELVYELSNIKNTLHSELRNMAETEVIAYKAAALSKLNKIKEMLENNQN